MPPTTPKGVPMPDADPITLLEHARTIAVVGFSTNPGKTAHAVPVHMMAAGYRIIPVHPSATEIAGQPAYPRLEDIPEPVDLVNVFRPSADTPPFVRSAAAIGAPAVWLQLGIRSEESRRIAEDAGMAYVEDRCIAVEHRRLPAT